MRPRNPERITADKANGCRLTLATNLLPGWVDGAKQQQIQMVPLLWKRDLSLPNGHELEAWLVWSEDDPSIDWIVDPKAVLAPNQMSSNVYQLRTLIHEASLGLTERKHRLSCRGLFNYLVEAGGPKLWVTDEQESIGVMTEFAFHCIYGQLRL